MTDLRRRMKEDLQLAGYSPRTQKSYIDTVRVLAELEQDMAAGTEVVRVCPRCKEGIMVVVSWLPKRARSPPPGGG